MVLQILFVTAGKSLFFPQLFLVAGFFIKNKYFS
jgi:hypothetical protein